MTQVQGKVPYRRLVDADLKEIDGSNPLPVQATGLGAQVCDVNSFDNRSFDPAETFTGGWVDVLGFSSLTFIINATSISATDGAVIEFSDNGTDIERVIDATVVGTVQGGEPLSVVLPVQARYFRVKYTNGAGPSTVSLQTIKRIYPMTSAQAPIGSEINAFSTAQLTRAILSGQQDDGDFGQLSVDNNGFLRINLAGQDTDVAIASQSTLKVTQANAFTVANGGPLKLISVPLAGRKSVAIKNPNETRNIYVGENPALTETSLSFVVNPGETITLDVDDTVDIYGLAEVDDTTRVRRVTAEALDSFGDVVTPQNAKLDDDQYADIGTVAGTDKIELLDYEPDVIAGRTVFDSVDDVKIVVKARRKSGGGTDPQLLLTYELDGVLGASSRTIDLTSTNQTQFELDITGDETVWTLADITRIKVILERNNGGTKRAEVDVAYLAVTESISDDNIRVAIAEVA